MTEQLRSAAELIADLQAEVESLHRQVAGAVADQRAARAGQTEAVRGALKPYTDTERALWWLLAQVEKDPRPARHDDECWLRHLNCFAERLRLGGGPLMVARELVWSREQVGRSGDLSV